MRAAGRAGRIHTLTYARYLKDVRFVLIMDGLAWRRRVRFSSRGVRADGCCEQTVRKRARGRYRAGRSAAAASIAALRSNLSESSHAALRRCIPAAAAHRCVRALLYACAQAQQL